MAQTLWYAYDRSGTVSGPFYESREEAFEHCDDGETPRPVSAAVVDAGGDADGDDGDDGDGLDGMGHDELKARAEEVGIAEQTDLRSREKIIEALRDYDE